MAVDKFIPTVWAREINRALRKSSVAENFINRNWEGEISEKGDTVKIIAPSGITVKTYTGADITFEDVSDTELELAIDQKDYFAFEIDDVDQAQANQDLMSIYIEEANYAMKDATDTYIFEQLKAGAASANIIDTIALTKSNLYDTIVDCKKNLGLQSVPGEARKLALSPEEIAFAEKSDELIHATQKGDQVLATGFFGKLAGFEIYETNNLPEDDPATILAGAEIATSKRARSTDTATITTDSAHGLETGDKVVIYDMTDSTYDTGLDTPVEITVTGDTTFTYSNDGDDEAETADTAGTVLQTDDPAPIHRYLPYCHPISTTFADQINSVEAVRREEAFKDGMKGLHLYGMKTIKDVALGYIKNKISDAYAYKKSL